jgi:isochorismate synthase
MTLVEYLDECVARNATFACFRQPEFLDKQSKTRFIGETEKNLARTTFSLLPFEATSLDEMIQIQGHIVSDIESLTHVNLPYPSPREKTRTAKPQEPTEKEEYENLVGHVKQMIDQKLISKLVLSRTKLVDKGRNFSPAEAFVKLLDSYRNAFVYIINHPDTGMWIGATPEVFLVGGKGKYETVSLAGTLPVIEGKRFGEWSDKEEEEQRIVTKYVMNKLEGAGADYILQHPREEQRAGNVVHLKSKISFHTKTDTPDLITGLHPTPAVCGLPIKSVRRFLQFNEKHNRLLYAGVLGEQTNGMSSLFVNLRCLRVLDKQLELYIGGGLVKDSDPEKEWMETEMKAQTLLSVIRNL